MRLALLLVVMVAAHALEMPSEYDSREKWGACRAFAPQNQGKCNSCAAMALASSLGIRACIRDQRNISFSAQRIWDCYSGSCERGVELQNFILAMMYGDVADYVLSRGAEGNGTCTGPKSEERIEAIGHHAEYWIGMPGPLKNRKPSTNISTIAMQSEILLNGPIIAILRLTAAEMRAFAQWKRKGDSEVLSAAPTQELRDSLHAVTVIGWGGSRETFYWKILNSFGEEWGLWGVGNIAGGFGLVEREWYAAVSTPLPCARGECVVPRSRKTEDAMFPPGAVPLLDQKNSLEDGAVLLITAACMLALSVVVCAVHGRLDAPKKRTRGVDHIIPAWA
jgi:hypothetical protein